MDENTVVPIGRCDTDDPYDAEHGGWTPEQLRELVESVLALHAAVWPHHDVDGDGDPASILLAHAESTRQRVQELRALAVAVETTMPGASLSDRVTELIEDLADHNVITWPDVELTPDPFRHLAG